MRFSLVIATMAILTVMIGAWAFEVLPSYFYQTLVLVTIGTVGIYFYLVEVKKERPTYFTQLYILTLFVKILAYGAYVLIVVWDDPKGADMNALFFMILYFFFTAAEVYFLYKKVTH
ncbi:MAG: hypothetical protein RLN86_09535 [Cyclobacteriaceae bacterium]